MSPAPIRDNNKQLVEDSIPYLLSGISVDLAWSNWNSYMNALRSSGPVTNVAALVGHGTLRANIAGFSSAELSDLQMNELRELESVVFESGAVGVSTGLVYPPGNFANFEELSAIATVAARFDRVYTSHLRGYRWFLDQSLKEAISIGEDTGVKIHISHLKAAGKCNEGRYREILQLIDNALSRGIQISFDLYPYEAGNTSLLSIFPPWVREGGKERTRERLADRSTRERLKKELFEKTGDWEPLVEPGAWNDVFPTSFRQQNNRVLEGKDLQSIASAVGWDPIDTVCELLLEEDLLLNMVNFHVKEPDIVGLISHPRCLVASDSIGVGSTSKTENIGAHPRYFGTFPTVIGRYARDRKIISVEEAINKMTGGPADLFGLRQRGYLKEDHFADVVILDLDALSSNATYNEPRTRCDGIIEVLVNGESVFHRGEISKERPGRILLSND
jgi:N-acyl-D-amino-acid deacylase